MDKKKKRTASISKKVVQKQEWVQKRVDANKQAVIQNYEREQSFDGWREQP